MNGWYAAVKVLINALCFIMGYLVAMVIRVTLFLLVQFFICFIVYVQSMCVPILRSIGTKLTKLEHMQKSRFIWFIWRHVTQKCYVMRHGDYDTSDRYFWQGTFWNQPEVSTTSGSKVMAQIVVSVTLTLTFDLFSIVWHTHCAWCTGISMRSFIRIRPVILGDMPWTHTHTHTYTHTHRRSF